jgi:Putative zincin peptidase
MALRLIDRFHPRLRRKWQEEIDAGRLRKVEAVELLGQEQLQPLARLSLYMLIVGMVFFGALNLAAYFWQRHTLAFEFSFGGLLLWLVVNIVAYVVILPLHEAVHGLVIALLGGKPYFGAKLPLALYCGAKNQLFRRNQYIMLALAPLVVLSLADIVLTLLAPVAASYVFFAAVGNFSGAAGDVWTTARIFRLPPDVLIEDTADGYQAWEPAFLPPLSSD